MRVVLRETYRHPSQADKASFPAREDSEMVRAYTKDTLLRLASEGDDDEEEEADEPARTSAPDTDDYPEADIGEDEPRDSFAGSSPTRPAIVASEDEG